MNYFSGNNGYAAARNAAAYRRYEIERRRAYEEQLRARREELEAAERIGNAPWYQRLGETFGDFAANLTTGLGKGIEGIVDFFATIGGAVAGIVSSDAKSAVKGFVETDHVGDWFGNDWQETLDKSWLNDNTPGRIVEGVASGIGQMLPSIIVSIATAGAGAPAAVAQAASLATLATSAAGTATEEAFREGANYGEGMLYGIGSGVVEAATEKMFGGFSKLYGKGFFDSVGKSVATTGLKRIAKEAAEEGVEEVVSELANPFLKTIYKGSDALKEYGSGDYWRGVAEAGIIGAGTSLVYSGSIGHAINRASGVNMDIDAAGEHIEKINADAQDLFDKGKLTTEEIDRKNQSTLADYGKIEKVLKNQKSDAFREKLIRNYHLSEVFESDGSLKADVRESLSKPAGKVNAFLSYGLQGQEEKINEILQKEGTKIFEGELTSEEQTQYEALKKASRSLSEKTGDALQFVIVDTMPTSDAFIADNVIAIGRDQLEEPAKWNNAIIHEVTHFAENSPAYEELRSFLFEHLSDAEIEEAFEKTAEKVYGDRSAEVDIEKSVRTVLDADTLLTEEQKTALQEKIAEAVEEDGGKETLRAAIDSMEDLSAEQKTGLFESVAEVVEKISKEREQAVSGKEVLEGLKEAIANDEELTETQKEFLREVMADKTAELLGKDEIIKKMTRKKPGLVRRLLERVVNFIKALGEGKETREARKVLFELQKRLETALETAGLKYQVDKAENKVEQGEDDNSDKASVVIQRSAKEYDSETAHLKDQIYNAKDILEKLKPVASYKFNEIKEFKEKSERIDWALKMVGITDQNPTIHIVVDSIGEVRITKSSIIDAMSHLKSIYEIMAVVLYPDVLKKGVKIGGHKNHKNTGVSTVTIGAPVVINEVRGNMGVVVKKNSLRSYTYRVLMPDGTAFIFNVETEESIGMPQGVSKKTSLSKATIDSSKNILSQNPEKSTPDSKKVQYSRKTPLISPEGKKMSEGQAEKAVANATREKVYSREDVGKIIRAAVGKMDASDVESLLFLVGELRGQGLAAVENQLYEKINTVDKDRRAALALDLADLILETATLKDVSSDQTHEESMHIISEVKGYLRRIDLSNLKGEIRHKYDKTSAGIFSRWGVRKGERAITVDMAAQELREAGVRLDTRSDNEADLLFEIDRVYSKALEDVKKEAKQRFKDALTKEEIVQQRQVIAKEILKEMDKGGKPSDFMRFADTRYWAQAAKNERSRNAALRDLDYEIGKLRDFKLGTYINATEFRGDNFEKSINRLAGIFVKGQLSDTLARKELKRLRAWYSLDNEMIKDYYNADLADMMNEILLGNDEEPLNAREINLLTTIVRGMRKFAETYQKVWKNGRWVDLDELAPAYVQSAKKAESIQVGWLEKLRRSRYFEEFADPMTVARMIDGYDEHGFYSEQLQNIRMAGVAAGVEEMDALKEYQTFLEKRKKFLKNLKTERVEYRGVSMTKAEAMQLYMSYKRAQAWEGLLYNGFYYTDAEGRRMHAAGVMTPGKYTMEELQGRAIAEQKTLKGLLSTEDLSFVGILERGYETAKKMKTREDMRKYGYTNAEDGYYVPIRRANAAKNVDQSNFMEDELNRVSNASFNKDTVKGAAQALDIFDVDRVFRSHLKAVSMYANLSASIDEFNRLYNYSVTGNKNDPTSIATVTKNRFRNGFEYFSKLIGDLQGISPTKDGSGLVNFIRGSYAKYQLGLNPKTWVTQMSSFFAGSSILDATSIMRGMTMSGKDVDTYCRLAELRNSDDTVAAAQAVLSNEAFERMNGFSSMLMKPIGMMDRFVVTKLFAACQVQAEKNGAGAIGTVENKKAAGELLTKVILETQQNSIATERSAAMRSGSDFKKAITMFTADSMKMIGRVVDSFGEFSTLEKALKSAKGDEKTAVENRLKTVKKNVRKSVSALVSSAVFMALVAKLFAKLYGKKEEEEPVKTFALDAVGNLIGGLPLVKDVYAFFAQGYEVSNYTYGTINDLLSAAKDVFSTAGQMIDGEMTEKDVAKLAKNVLYAGGAVLGIPTRNAQNIAHGLMTYITPEIAYKYDALLYGQNYKKDLVKAIEDGDESRADMIIDLIVGEKTGSVKDDRTMDTLRSLTKAGYDVLPRSVGKTVTYNGEQISLTKNQKDRFQTVYDASSDAVKDLVGLEKFRAADEETQARAVKWIWDTYYNLALSDVVGEEIENKNVLFAQAIPIEKLALISAQAKAITADKDKKGTIVSGSKKTKVERYVNGLRLSVAQKYMVMGYLGYKNANGEKLVKAYVSRLKLTKAEKQLLLKYCGY